MQKEGTDKQCGTPTRSEEEIEMPNLLSLRNTAWR